MIEQQNTGVVDNLFTEVFKRYRDILFHYARNYVERKDVCKDMVMEAFKRLYEHKEGIENKDHLIRSLFVSVRNQCIDHARWKEGRETSNIPELSEETIINNIVRYEVIQELYGKINQLPKQRRSVMHYLFQEDRNRNEVAKILSLPVASIDVIKHQAIKQLKTMCKI